MKNQYKKFNLTDNPFSFITPTLSSETNVFWAGMPKIKSELNEIYNNALEKAPRQIVLNWGPWGGGKTFSAYYFISNPPKKPGGAEFTQIYVRSPKNGNIATSEFFRNIVDFISYSKIKKQITFLRKSMDETKLITFLNDTVKSEDFTNAILLFGSEEKETQDLMHRYLYDGLTKRELKTVGLARNLNSNTDFIKLLSGIIVSFIGNQKDVDGRVILWIDELEDLIYYSQKEYRSFSQTLRDFADTINHNLTIFLNFTLAEPEESTIELMLGEALWSRINKKIRFEDLDVEGALLYCKELIEVYQIDKSKDYNPFNEEILKMILDRIPEGNLTPRNINKFCGAFLEYSLKQNAKSINKELLNDWSTESLE